MYVPACNFITDFEFIYVPDDGLMYILSIYHIIPNRALALAPGASIRDYTVYPIETLDRCHENTSHLTSNPNFFTPNFSKNVPKSRN